MALVLGGWGGGRHWQLEGREQGGWGGLVGVDGQGLGGWRVESWVDGEGWWVGRGDGWGLVVDGNEARAIVMGMRVGPGWKTDECG